MVSKLGARVCLCHALPWSPPPGCSTPLTMCPSSPRYAQYKKWSDTIDKTEGGLDKFSKGYHSFGLNVQPDNSILYREWAPAVTSASLVGDFSE